MLYSSLRQLQKVGNHEAVPADFQTRHERTFSVGIGQSAGLEGCDESGVVWGGEGLQLLGEGQQVVTNLGK